MGTVDSTSALDHYLELTTSAMRNSLARGHDVVATVHAAMLERLEFATGDPRRRGCVLVNAAYELLPPGTRRRVRPFRP